MPYLCNCGQEFDSPEARILHEIDCPVVDEARRYQQDTTAVITIAPALNPKVQKLTLEVQKINQYAKALEIKDEKDLPAVTNDLVMIKNLTKAVEAKRKEYLDPVNKHAADIRAAFDTLLLPLAEADNITRYKRTAYDTAVRRRIEELAAIEAKRLELARMEAQAHDGEHTQDLTPIEKPPEPPVKVTTQVGAARTTMVPKWRLIDFSKLPDKYKVSNDVLIGKLVRAGEKDIPGIEVWEEPGLRVTSRG